MILATIRLQVQEALDQLDAIGLERSLLEVALRDAEWRNVRRPHMLGEESSLELDGSSCSRLDSSLSRSGKGWLTSTGPLMDTKGKVRGMEAK